MPSAVPARPPSAPSGPAVSWILRFGLAACFIGHGTLGLNRIAAWTSYFAVVGIGHDNALSLMPWVGAFDVAMALSVLFRPTRAVILYMMAWAMWTALLRPLAGESFWEAVERAGNYGVPIALFLLFPDGGVKSWLSRDLQPPDENERRSLDLVLRVTTVLLLLGHGALNLIVRKPMFCAQYALLGLPGAGVEPVIGSFELLLALAVLLKPDRHLLLGVVAWKVATEALCPLAGSPWWVFVEHGGSYAAPLALAFLSRRARTVFVPTTLLAT